MPHSSVYMPDLVTFAQTCSGCLLSSDMELLGHFSGCNFGFSGFFFTYSLWQLSASCRLLKLDIFFSLTNSTPEHVNCTRAIRCPPVALIVGIFCRMQENPTVYTVEMARVESVSFELND